MSSSKRHHASSATTKSTTAKPATSTMTPKTMSNAYDAFAAVDQVVSKPVMGSDGAASWQQFRQEVRSLDHNTHQGSSNAPKAPLKKADKLGTGFQTWDEEVKHETQLKQQAGVTEVGYVHFKQKDSAEEAAKRKEMKRIEKRIRPKDKEYYLASATFQGHKFDYVFTTRDWGTGYYWDGMDSLKQLKSGVPLTLETKTGSDHDDDDNNDEGDGKKKRERDNPAAAVSKNVDSDKKKKKRKRSLSGPVIVNDPNHPMEQVAQALQRRNAAALQPFQQFMLNNSTSSSSSSNIAAAGSLPAGWEAATDPGTGNTYYFCRATGERQWQHPSMMANAADATTSTATTTASTTKPHDNKPASTAASTSDTPSTTAVTTDSLPDGWSVAKDPNTGKDYYFHTASGETSWERPLKDKQG